MTWGWLWFTGLGPLAIKYGLVALAIVGLLVLAWYSPFFKKTILWVASVLIVTTIAYSVGVKDEHTRMQKLIDAAIQQEQKAGEKAHSDAERTIERDNTPSELRDDLYNRDRKQ